MRRILRITFLLAAGIFILSSCKTDERQTKNLIVMIPDGTSTSLLPVTRWYKFTQDSTQNYLHLDSLIVGMVRSHHSNAAVAASPAAMSAYMTGYLHTSSNISVYPKASSQDMFYVDSTRKYQPLVTVFEAAKLNKKAIGTVTTVSFCHATPAATMSHSSSRNDISEIAYQMASQDMDIVVGSGTSYIDEHLQNILKEKNIALYQNDIEGFRAHKEGKMWALWKTEEMDYDMDRDPSVQPSLTEVSLKALDILSKNKDGFCLLIEGGLVDYAAHANDPIALVREFKAFDEAVAAVVEWARKDGNTTVVIMPDHGTSMINYPNQSYTKKYITKADSIFLNLAQAQVSYNKMAEILAQTPKDKIRSVFKEKSGIDLKQEQYEQIIANLDVVVEDYTEVYKSQNLQSIIAQIYLSATNISFASTTHTVEDVFLAAYHPKGYVPTGIIRNIDLSRYMCEVLGFPKSLDEYTDENFVKHTLLFEGAEFEIENPDSIVPILKVKKDGKALKAEAYSSYVEIDGQRVELALPVVYIAATKSFYLPKNLGF